MPDNDDDIRWYTEMKQTNAIHQVNAVLNGIDGLKMLMGYVSLSDRAHLVTAGDKLRRLLEGDAA